MRPPGWRSAVGTALFLLAVGGCGDAASTQDASGPAEASALTGDTSARLLEIVTGTAAGGEVDPTPVPVRDATELSGFLEQFSNQGFVRELRLAVRAAEVAEGQLLVASVVAVGCEVPTEVSVLGPPGDVTIVAVPSVRSPRECFAPMTSVALVSMPDSLLTG